MRSEHAHIFVGRGPAGKADAAASRAMCSSLRRELKVWYRRLRRRLRGKLPRGAYRSNGRP